MTEAAACGADATWSPAQVTTEGGRVAADRSEILVKLIGALARLDVHRRQH